jgi:hypothetical protein
LHGTAPERQPNLVPVRMQDAFGKMPSGPFSYSNHSRNEAIFSDYREKLNAQKGNKMAQPIESVYFHIICTLIYGFKISKFRTFQNLYLDCQLQNLKIRPTLKSKLKSLINWFRKVFSTLWMTIILPIKTFVYLNHSIFTLLIFIVLIYYR